MGHSMEWMNIFDGVLQNSAPLAFVSERSDAIFKLSPAGDAGRPQSSLTFEKPGAYFKI